MPDACPTRGACEREGLLIELVAAVSGTAAQPTRGITARGLTRTTNAPLCSPPTPGRADPGRTQTVRRTSPVCAQAPGGCAPRPARVCPGPREVPRGGGRLTPCPAVRVLRPVRVLRGGRLTPCPAVRVPRPVRVLRGGLFASDGGGNLTRPDKGYGRPVAGHTPCAASAPLPPWTIHGESHDGSARRARVCAGWD